ncbi:hypothetical protein [Stenotrophomonas indicatrix]|jgi:hypothetical protein|uniref:hypothetical protein n=1 Tax=Stenotrophomonas indicatrix TaxID=2045451 RepID=UPI0028ABBEC0|nr:hypothetical protein [Stenotrophomonas indicatrix]
MSSKYTAGPWHWFEREDGHVYLATPDRGHLYVMDFARKGMRGATPRFSLWNGDDRGRQGGIMHDFLEAGGTLHPDARLIAAAPDLLDAALSTIDTIEGGPTQVADAITALRAAIAKATGEGA